MRRSKAYPAIALMAGAALMLTGMWRLQWWRSGAMGRRQRHRERGPNALAVNPGHLHRAEGQRHWPGRCLDRQAVYRVQQRDGRRRPTYNSDALIQPRRSSPMTATYKVLLDKDVMDSVEVASTSPQVVDVEDQEGRELVGRRRLELQGLLPGVAGPDRHGPQADGKTTLPGAAPGYDQIDTAECPDDNRPYVTFRRRSLTGRACSALHAPGPRAGASRPASRGHHQADPAESDRHPDQGRGLLGAPNWKGFKADLATGSGAVHDQRLDGRPTRLVRNPKWSGNPAGPAKITQGQPDYQTACSRCRTRRSSVLGASRTPSRQELKAASGGHHLRHRRRPDLRAPGPQPEERPCSSRTCGAQGLRPCVNRNDLVNKLIAEVQPDAKPLGSVLFFPGEPATPTTTPTSPT